MRLALSLGAALAAFACTCFAQQAAQDIAEIATHSGIIVRGTVLGVTVEAPRAPDEVAAVRVTVRVEDGIRGAATGEMLTFRQWNAFPDEYRVGESLVLFLHAPSEKSGLTSPVGGRAGHRRVDEVPAELLNSWRAVRPAATPVVTQPLARPTRSRRP